MERPADCMDNDDADDACAFTALRLAEHLAACEAAYRVGNLEAIVAAMTWCETYGGVPPRWLSDAVARLVDLRTTSAERDAQREAMLHYERYDAVQELLARSLRGERQFDGGPLRNIADIYVRVAEYYGVSDKAIERSCSVVRKDIKEGRAAKYFLAGYRHF
jgi:hypothetical protein